MRTRPVMEVIDDHEFLTVSEVASRLRVSPWTVRSMIRTGRLSAFKVKEGSRRSRWRIPARELSKVTVVPRLSLRRGG